MAAMNRSPVSESSRAREMVFPPWVTAMNRLVYPRLEALSQNGNGSFGPLGPRVGQFGASGTTSIRSARMPTDDALVLSPADGRGCLHPKVG